MAVETNAMGVIGRQYDSIGRNLGFAFGSDYAVTYAYDGVGRLSSLTSDLGTPTSAFSYSYLHNSDLLAGWGNGTIQVMRSYEEHRNLLTAVTNLVGGTLVSTFNYANDAMGRRTQRIDAGSAVATNLFTYNSRSELTNAIMNANAFGWTLDNIGNRLSDTSNSVIHDYTANALNQYTQITNGGLRTLAYDLDGNLTNDAIFAYAWDGENRLIAVQSGSGVLAASYSYDYMSRRVQKIAGSATNTFSYDGWNLVRELITDHGSPVTNIYVWGLDLSGTLQGAGGTRARGVEGARGHVSTSDNWRLKPMPWA